ncbi:MULTISPECIES: DUF2243 domain-containing protein [Actinomadura]|uniref:DUF2243 domain-containing protein n=1 Tax=Actinomadura yumaensis TaxID=111807 RepID=A0ABW2CXJ4_9ACTN|nr:DUF2243 domain-containing protein [Actinomadura sp. J1-007]MWK39627.1 DUF2243 domain-containing protein [Actinomadura sp. J1-007]
MSTRTAGSPAAAGRSRGGIALPGTVLGLGMGGFVDGIMLHQVLQWHHMLSSTGSDRLGLKRYSTKTVSGLEMNTVWDGFFHVFTWLCVLAGLAMLYARLNEVHGPVWRSRGLWGWLAVGWGVFNLVEGIIDHEILGIHHVRSGPNHIWWDLGFLAVGALLVAGGWLLQRGGEIPRREA